MWLILFHYLNYLDYLLIKLCLVFSLPDQNTYTNADKLLEAAEQLAQTGECDPEEIYKAARHLEVRIQDFVRRVEQRKLLLDMSVSFHTHTKEVRLTHIPGGLQRNAGRFFWAVPDVLKETCCLPLQMPIRTLCETLNAFAITEFLTCLRLIAAAVNSSDY